MSYSLPDVLNELKELPHWVAFRLETTDGEPKPRKVPLNPTTGDRAKANDAATWGTFAEAVAFAERLGYFENRTGGVGFEFGEPGGLAGIDLDDVILPDGTLKPYAREIVETMNSYTELSPSGHGLHILFRLLKPLSAIGSRHKKPELEIYDTGRYFTITGQVYGAMKPIAERTAELQVIYERYFGRVEAEKEREAPDALKTKYPPSPVDTYTPTEDLTDGELWERMFEKEPKIRALYHGDLSGYGGDWSRADLALCNYLAYWTGKDPNRADRMFRQSGLMRPKWDERHGSQTYGQLTIAEAMRAVREYAPQSNYTAPVLRLSDASKVNAQVSTGEREFEFLEPYTISTPLEWVPPTSGFDYVDSGTFQADLERFQKYPEIFTGFQNFDEAQGGLSAGLFVIGATPSLGKTTFLVQMADNIAKSGVCVLYFSLEQSRLELTTKSISRLTAERDIKSAVSAINIRRGRYANEAQSEAVKKAIAAYQEFSQNVAIVELGLDATISTVTDTVKRFMDFTLARPVVMVDYLQILRPDNEKLSTKDAVDHIVRALKKLQVDNNLVVMVISSFNRTNYLAPVDYESFKETGSVEYTSDVLLGLQPQIMTDKLFDADKKVKEKREAIDAAISAIPRKVMLKNLKNRFGRKGYACGFTYDPRFDLFVPDMSFRGVSTGEKAAIL